MPSLNRLVDRFSSKQDRELMRAVAYMRKWRFAKLLLLINVVPYWMAKLSDVNFDALAQHYGFPTHLLDLTNDFKTALFFATCVYEGDTDSYRPLTQEDIDGDTASRFGCIFHTPNWTIDYLGGDVFLRWMSGLSEDESAGSYSLQSGKLDGMAFQIGYQPMQRCSHQSGYVYPMRNLPPLQEDEKFEVLRFKQTVELSRRVYEAMDGGEKVFPFEGVTALHDDIKRIQTCTTFSVDELDMVFKADGVSPALFPTPDSLREGLEGFLSDAGPVTVIDDPIEVSVPQEVLDKVNAKYDGVDLLQQVGGVTHIKHDDRDYFEQRSLKLFGEIL